MNEEQSVRFATALKRLSGDVELLSSMAMIVSDDVPGIVAELEEQLEAGDSAGVVASAHKLKGMCSTFETGHPVTALEDVLHAARGGDVSTARELYQRCQPDLRELMQEISKLAQS
ncbi:Hpt domain-containing protein [Rosistilla oblonga]|uniref:Hpt domain-containing protein n=1 Tax=Rosistilla oblonga TaxID=2527990 RepID=UPI003A97A758